MIYSKAYVDELHSIVNNLLKDYVRVIDAHFTGAYKGLVNFSFAFSIPSGYKIISEVVNGYVSGDENAYTSDKNVNSSGDFNCFVHNPNNSTISLNVEVLAIRNIS